MNSTHCRTELIIAAEIRHIEFSFVEKSKNSICYFQYPWRRTFWPGYRGWICSNRKSMCLLHAPSPRRCLIYSFETYSSSRLKSKPLFRIHKEYRPVMNFNIAMRIFFTVLLSEKVFLLSSKKDTYIVLQKYTQFCLFLL